MSNRWLSLVCVLAILGACGEDDGGEDPADSPPALAGEVTVLETYSVGDFNADLDPELPTASVAFYLTEGGPLEWNELVPGIERAKRVFLDNGVQLRVSWAVLVSVPPDWQSLDPEISEVPSSPEYLETDIYRHLDELATRLTDRTRDILEAIVWQHPPRADGVPFERSVHVVALEDVPISYFEWDGAWSEQFAPTGGLSFPPYVHGDRIAPRLRGIITLSVNPNPLNRATRVLAHELGHKLINVSHEGIGVCPSFEADGDDLMLYGEGERVASGAEGRWHRERLALSPFLYHLDGDIAVFDNDYRDSGSYRDRLYGDFVVEPPCAGTAGSR
ncbi:MAG: hypothetical protein KJO07_03520 [Deltaproteobacteria bacterium]|nr:hypothetical protein [Deltaproteobacteria bacterium]